MCEKKHSVTPCRRQFCKGTKTCTPGRRCRHYWNSSSFPVEPSGDLCTQRLETDTTRTKRITVGNLESTLMFHPDTWMRARLVDFKSASCRAGQDKSMAYHFPRGRLWVIAIQFRCTSKSVELYAGTNSRRTAAKAARIRYSGVVNMILVYQSRVNDRHPEGKDRPRCEHMRVICKCRKRSWARRSASTNAPMQLCIE